MAPRSARMTPAGPRHVSPPGQRTVVRAGTPARTEHERGRLEPIRRRIGEVLRIGPALGERDPSGRGYETAELPVRHGFHIDPEAFDARLPGRRLFRIMVVRPHPESSPCKPDHAATRGRPRFLLGRRQAPLVLQAAGRSPVAIDQFAKLAVVHPATFAAEGTTSAGGGRSGPPLGPPRAPTPWAAGARHTPLCAA